MYFTSYCCVLITATALTGGCGWKRMYIHCHYADMWPLQQNLGLFRHA